MNDSHDNSNNDSGDDLNLQDLWQETPPVNVDDLVKSVKSAQRRMRRYVYSEIAGCVVGLALLVWIFKDNVFGDQWWIPTLMGLVAFGGQAWAFTWRIGVWNAFAKSPTELFQLKRRLLLLDIKIARSIYIGVVVGGVIGGIGAFFDMSERNLELSGFARGSILAAAIGFMLFMFFWGVRIEIKARKQLKELEKQIKNFENEENL